MSETFLLHKNNEGNYAAAFIKSRESLRQRPLDEIIVATLCSYDSSKNLIHVESFGHSFEVSYPDGSIGFVGSEQSPPMDWSLILLNYLSCAKEVGLTGEEATYRDLPQGNVFFQNIKINVLDVLSKYYTQCGRHAVADRLVQLGFILKNNGADIYAQGLFAPRIPVTVKFWEGEEGLPSACQILFDRSVYFHMHMEDIAALCSVLRDLMMNP